MIQNLIKGNQQNNTSTEAAQGNGTDPAVPKKTVQDPKPETQSSVQEVDSVSVKEESESLGNLPLSHRRYLTPQLSAELSQFSGLSLRLEDNAATNKVDNKNNLPLSIGKPFVIGVCGGNCAGKMDLVNYLVNSLGQKRCTILKQENFYKPIPEQESIEDYNYDDPDATDWEYMQQGLDALLYHRKPFHTPVYNFKLNKRDLKTEEVWPNPIIIVEGLLIFHIEGIRKRLDLKVFLDTDDDIRLSRRIMKGYLKLGRNVDSIVERYKKFVKPCHEKYVLPSRKFSDIIVPNFGTSVCEELDLYAQDKIAAEANTDKSKKSGKAVPTLPKVNVALELLVEQIKFQLEDMNKIRVFQKKT